MVTSLNHWKEFLNGPEWKELKDSLEGQLEEVQSTLENADSTMEIYRAQGAALQIQLFIQYVEVQMVANLKERGEA